MINYFINLYQRCAARNMFARWSPDYEQEVAENAYSAANKVAEKSIELLVVKPGQNLKILDVGIGTGLAAQQLHNALPCRITGLDFTEDMMAVCAMRGVAETLIKCDVGRDIWPVPNGSFDAVVSAGLLEYLTPDMLQHFFGQADRVVQQNGLLIFTYTPSEKSKSLNIWRGHSGTYLSCASAPQAIEKDLKSRNFAILEHTQTFAGCLFQDGSSYDYRLIAAQKN